MKLYFVLLLVNMFNNKTQINGNIIPFMIVSSHQAIVSKFYIYSSIGESVSNVFDEIFSMIR